MMPLHHQRNALFATVAWLCTACVVDPHSPDGAQISCARQTDCPGDLVCHEPLGRCLSPDGLDESLCLPELTLPSGQTEVKNGDPVTVSGRVLAGSPILRVTLVDIGLDQTVENLATDSIYRKADGSIQGSFSPATLSDGTTVALELVFDLGGRESSGAACRSAPLQVDTTPPAGASIAVVGGAVVTSAVVNLDLVATGAEEVYLDGDIVDSSVARTWLPMTERVGITLTPADGGKVVRARFRDGAHNTAEAATNVVVDSRIPESRPLLVSPWQVTKVKNDDTVTVGGTADANGQVASAALLALDSLGQELADSGCHTDVTSQISLVDGALSGNINIGTVCAEAAQLVIRVLVENGAGTLSEATASTSPALAIDNGAPVSTSAILIGLPLAQPNHAADPNIVLLLTAEDDENTPIEVRITGDVENTGRVGDWVPFPGPQVPAGEEPVLLVAGDDAKTVSVQFRDAVNNTSAPITLNLTLDTSPPGLSGASALRLSEDNPAPNDPATLAQPNNTFILTGLASAVVGASRVGVFADSDLAAFIDDFPVAGDGSFSGELQHLAAETFFVVALDASGNQSPAVVMSVPQCTNLTASPDPGGIGVQTTGRPIQIGLECDVDVGTTTLVTVDGSPATLLEQTGRALTFEFSPTGSERHYPDQTVVRVYAEDTTGRFAPGTIGTDAITMTLDLTPPVINPSALAVSANPPGTNDSLVGMAGAIVGDDLTTDITALAIEIFDATGEILLASRSPAANGGFPAVDLGDNLHASVIVVVADGVGNQAAVDVANDILGPTANGLLATPSALADGAACILSFDLIEDHDLAALPVVSVGGRLATHVSGDLAVGDGLLHTFAYSLVANQASDSEGPAMIEVQLVDDVGNSAISTAMLDFDFSPPTSVNRIPGNAATWNGHPGVAGTAQDAITAIAQVEVSLLDIASGLYWSGAAFDSGTEEWRIAGGAEHWLLLLDGVPLVPGNSYTIRWRPEDLAGNQESPAPAWTFQAHGSGSEAPTGLSAESPSEARIRLTWTAPSVAPDHYLVYYASEEEEFPPFVGRGAEQGDSPIVATGGETIDITELLPGHHTFAVTAVDASGNESAFSNQASAASQWWLGLYPSPTGNRVRSVTHVVDDVFIAVGPGGLIWRSEDDGLTWSSIHTGVIDSLEQTCSNGTDVVVIGYFIPEGQTDKMTTVYHSADGGLSFTRAELGLNLYIKEVWCHGAQAVAVGGALGDPSVYFSDDSGATWAEGALPGTDPLASVWGTDTYVVAAGWAGVMRSTDGGATWTEVVAPGSKLFYQVRGDDNRVAAAGQISLGNQEYISVIVHSDDGGLNWNAFLELGSPLNAIWIDGDRILAAGSGGTFIRSLDGGTSWDVSTIQGVPWNSTAIMANGARVVVLSGGNQLFSPDGGDTWPEVANQIPNLSSLAAHGMTLLAAGAWQEFPRSTDFGQTWVSQDPYAVVTADDMWTDGTTFVGVGDAGFVLRSIDGGQSWTTPEPITRYDLNTVAGSGNNIVASGSETFHSADRGATWQVIDPGFTSIQDIWADNDTFIAVGYQGQIGMSTDGGLTWTLQFSEGTPRFRQVRGRGNEIVAFGSGPSLASSLDRGITWQVHLDGGNSFFRMNAVWFDDTRGIAAGDNAVILQRQPGGLSWVEVTSGASRDIWAAWGTETALFTGGESNQFYDGEMFRSLDGGTSWTEITNPNVGHITGFAGTDNLLFVITTSQLYFSTDRGTTWAQSTHHSPYSSGTVNQLLPLETGPLYGLGSGVVIVYGPE